jgi:membrane associated rhomboid family serine protease
MAMKLPPGRATDILCGVTAAAYFIALLGGWQDLVSVLGGFIPARVHAFEAQGMVIGLPWLPVWLTPLTATLIHGGLMHLAFNLVMLFYCGRQVEALLGSGRMLLVYAVGAYAAAAAQWAAMPSGVQPMVGASGAISAVLGCYALIYSQREVRAFGPIPAQVVRVVWMAAGWTGLQLMIALAGLTGGGMFASIAIWAHVGGFIAGLLLARPMLLWRFGVWRKD